MDGTNQYHTPGDFKSFRQKNRLVIVTSRLPVTIKPDKNPPLETASGHAYTSTLLGITDELDYEEIVWIGWPGTVHAEKAEEDRCTECLKSSSSTSTVRYIPVWLSKDEVDRFFYGYCNNSLWPLLHWMTPYAHFKTEWAETYWSVSDRFAEAVRGVTDAGDVVWVHDYHLLLLPMLLRDMPTGSSSPEGVEAPSNARSTGSFGDAALSALKQPHKLQVAFFLHTPFPSYEILSVHPHCNLLLEGVLGADLIGFHTYTYLRHFRSSVLRVLGFSTQLDRIDHNGMRTELGVFPIGPNVRGMEDVMRKEPFWEHLRDYTVQFEGKNVVLSVERLDYSKGLPQKMAAIRRYLQLAQQESKEGRGQREDAFAAHLDSILREKKAKGSTRHPLIRMGASMMKAFVNAKPVVVDHTKTVFVFIAIPSRQGDGDVTYQEMEEQVQQSVSEINGHFSTPTHQPIVFIHKNIPTAEMAALYARADCFLVTPLIDGMNLLAKEFLVAKDRSQGDRSAKAVPGVVVISELTGAAQELFDALVVNPHDENAVAQAILFALEMDLDDRWVFTENMRREVLKNDAGAWAEGLLAKLGTSDDLPLASDGLKQLPDEAAESFMRTEDGVKALFLDFSGTLEDSGVEGLSAETKDICAALNERASGDGDLVVYIMSGHGKEVLEEQFEGYANLTLVAEHGSFCRRPGERRWEARCQSDIAKWKELVRPVMQLFVKSTPGSRIEVDKASTIVWHYSNCDTVYGEFKAHELVHLLSQSLMNLPCQIYTGDKTVEVASLQANKGVVVQTAFDDFEMVHGEPFQAVLCAGDDRTDEPAFLAASSLGSSRPNVTVVTAKVGAGESHAKYRIAGPADLRRFLMQFLSDELSVWGRLSKWRSRQQAARSSEEPKSPSRSPGGHPEE
mmetsp:Transcript_21641/g.50577  ORF Transcript_21641/g.50577 Transcript_21641/m.50577 type:complete len:903 (-) Transcript_21641:110-2818(-)